MNIEAIENEIVAVEERIAWLEHDGQSRKASRLRGKLAKLKRERDRAYLQMQVAT